MQKLVDIGFASYAFRLKNFDVKIFEKLFPLHFSGPTIRSPPFKVSLLLSKCREVFSTDEL